LAQSPAAKGDPWDHADEDISTKIKKERRKREEVRFIVNGVTPKW
jgi:hypothetical protein